MRLLGYDFISWWGDLFIEFDLMLLLQGGIIAGGRSYRVSDKS
ncbi:hypothetical protein RINTHH_5600 [Richelia intracellularis HH01]|uniref:Uncharacterized protein n=1 Tax=Richelia intracellularis HH01 TaxID=1165094 RepID=M1X2F1_9NOST|nr:hypothetical protein RINTHH_5600 [Richelia intracellularis HH01]